MQEIKFDCGCFVCFWPDKENVGEMHSALACCKTHEAPNQSIKNLSKDHYFSIEKKYVQPKVLSIKEQLDLVQTRYQDAIIKKHDKYGDVMVLSVPVSADKWNTNQTRIAVGVPAGYPYRAPEFFWIDSNLRLKSGTPPNRVSIHQEDICGEDMYMLQGKVQRWTPWTDTLYTAIKIVDLALQYRFVPPKYDANWD